MKFTFQYENKSYLFYNLENFVQIVFQYYIINDSYAKCSNYTPIYFKDYMSHFAYRPIEESYDIHEGIIFKVKNILCPQIEHKWIFTVSYDKYHENNKVNGYSLKKILKDEEFTFIFEAEDHINMEKSIMNEYPYKTVYNYTYTNIYTKEINQFIMNFYIYDILNIDIFTCKIIWKGKYVL